MTPGSRSPSFNAVGSLMRASLTRVPLAEPRSCTSTVWPAPTSSSACWRLMPAPSMRTCASGTRPMICGPGSRSKRWPASGPL
jgi:hypothetical protein